ncbi:hypothetical protein [Paucibacter sp. TC2R-5]|uniref:hypothetical protein n=1 Tax=Paucibacter sp. TC2R-5 TaxID=2893555 RepID=UPI0021E4A291|nr:hypothetical protein [Paucibacter sp. TC2R-5]
MNILPIGKGAERLTCFNPGGSSVPVPEIHLLEKKWSRRERFGLQTQDLTLKRFTLKVLRIGVSAAC